MIAGRQTAKSPRFAVIDPTVELHRARIFDKLEVSNAVELVRVLGVLEK